VPGGCIQIIERRASSSPLFQHKLAGSFHSVLCLLRRGRRSYCLGEVSAEKNKADKKQVDDAHSHSLIIDIQLRMLFVMDFATEKITDKSVH
jgi:hypothetical protein